MNLTRNGKIARLPQPLCAKNSTTVSPGQTFEFLKIARHGKVVIPMVAVRKDHS